MEEKIRNIVKEVLKLDDEQNANLMDDTNLIDFGLDSLTSVEIIVNIESEFDIFTNDDDLLVENLATINLLADLVKKYSD